MTGLEKTRKKLEDFIHTNIAGSEIRSKKDSKFMNVLSKLLFFNKRFMTGYVTTWYPYIYVPRLPWKEKNHAPAIATLAHEWVHLHDRQRLGWFFNFLYTSPQCLFIFGLLGFWNLWFLLFFLFLLPLPSPGRAWAEFRGYRMTIAVYYWLSGQRVDLKWTVDQFISSNYYFMWPFRGWLMKKFQKEFDKIREDNLTPELMIIKNVLKN
tara:strand:+ start:2215 stop:2841 length:627 start_codon:yes stop_codon:yes gene_type:complete